MSQQTIIQDNDILQQSTITSEQMLNNVENGYGHGNCTYEDLEDMAEQMIASLPKLNRTKLQEEMQTLHVAVFTDPTTAQINVGLALVQGYKERLAGIFVLAMREVQMRTKAFELLQNAGITVSKQSSADKRKGEALMRYPQQFILLESAKIFADEVEMFMNNMKATGETISRQVSVLQLQLSIGEIHRKPAEEINW